MKKVHFLIFFIIICVFLNGCITTRRVKKTRVDQEITGNVGYIEGDESICKKKKSTNVVKDREYFEIDIEVPPFPEMRDRYWKDDEISGNQGYISGGPKQ